MQNFGKIKNTFNHVMAEGIVNNDKKNKLIFKSFTSLLKENEVLKTQYNVYFDIENRVDEDTFKSSEFVKESISLLSKFSSKEIASANKKLVKLLEDNKIDFIDDYPKSQLHEDISKLIFTKKSSSTVNTIVESLNNVVNYVKTNTPKTKVAENFFPNSMLSALLVDKFNEKYSDLNESDKKLFKVISESDSEGKKEFLKETKNQCVDLLNEHLKNSSVDEKEKILEVKDNILRLEYNEETFITDITKIIELKTNLNND